MSSRIRFINVMTFAAMVLALGSALISVKMALVAGSGLATQHLTSPCGPEAQEPS